MPISVKFFVIGIIFLVALHLVNINTAKAVISSCTASATPSQVALDSTTDFTITVTNSNGNPINWVSITTPSSDFTYNQAYTADTWNPTFENSVVATFVDGEIASGGSATFILGVAASGDEISGASWTVTASDDSGGSNPTTCTGSLSAEIVSAPVISALAVTAASTSATFTWTTDKSSNTVVEYGTTTSYGSSKTDSTLTTSHSITITGLAVSSTYHFRVKSTDANSNTTTSSDNTFTTSTTVTTTTITNTITNTIKDTTNPTVSLSTDFKQVYLQAPQIIGTASDDVGITSVDFSIDDGENWLPVDTLSAIGAKTATFSFIPLGMRDGTYDIKVRATDPSGNATSSRSYKLTIDRLPPTIGGIVYSIGPQIVEPNKSGVIILLEDTKYKFTLSMSGGPVLSSVKYSNDSLEKEIELSKNMSTGLWHGEIKIDLSGTYSLSVFAEDGAENKINKSVGSVIVLEKGKILEDESSVSDANISIYVQDKDSKEFSIWDGSQYGISNPQMSDENGKYSLVLPSGVYYLEVKKSKYETSRTNIFKVIENVPITSNINISSINPVKIFGWEIPLLNYLFSNILVNNENLKVNEMVASFDEVDLIGKAIPSFIVESRDDAKTNLDFRGDPSVIVLLSGWLPETGIQISEMDEIVRLLDETDKNMNIIPVLVQSPPTFASLFQLRGGYKTEIYTDKDGLMANKLGLYSYPVHIFLNRRGEVKNVISGILTADEILVNMSR